MYNVLITDKDKPVVIVRLAHNSTMLSILKNGALAIFLTCCFMATIVVKANQNEAISALREIRYHSRESLSLKIKLLGKG